MNLPIYLDYMASTPLDPRVLAKINECLTSPLYLGNASSQHHLYGWQAAELIENARQQVADSIHADAREIIWTSGATEANNLALKGAAEFYRRKGQHIITMASEHKSVLNTCKYLESQGFTVTYLQPDANGLLDLQQFSAAIRADTILASIMWINSETGVIQDIASIAQITRQNGVILHVDAAQAAGRIGIDVQSIPIDLLSFSAHKVYGPKGVGALFLRRSPRVRLQPQIHGGEQERGLRSGTLATPQIVAMGTAFMIAQQNLVEDNQHADLLGKRLLSGLQAIPGVHLNGDLVRRIPHCINVSIDGVNAETLLCSLNQLALSTGSACHSAHTTPSHVLTAMGINRRQAQSALRFSLGRFTTVADIDLTISEVKEKVNTLRELSPLYNL